MKSVQSAAYAQTNASMEVYDQRKAPTPVVVNPEGCIQGCHGCGNLCPNGAITYVGDKAVGNIECSCSTEDDGVKDDQKKTVKIKAKKPECSCGGNCC